MNNRMLKKVVIGIAIIGAGYFAYKMLTKKKTRIIRDEGFEIEVEVPEEE